MLEEIKKKFDSNQEYKNLCAEEADINFQISQLNKDKLSLAMKLDAMEADFIQSVFLSYKELHPTVSMQYLEATWNVIAGNEVFSRNLGLMDKAAIFDDIIKRTADTPAASNFSNNAKVDKAKVRDIINLVEKTLGVN